LIRPREISSGTIAGLRAQEAQLTAQEAVLARYHGDQYPELQQIRASLQDLRGQIARAVADRYRQMGRDRTAALQTVERSRAQEQDSAPCFVFEVGSSSSLSGSTGKYAISSSDGDYIEEKGILYMAYRLNDIVTFLDAGQQLSDCDNVERATVPFVETFRHRFQSLWSSTIWTQTPQPEKDNLIYEMWRSNLRQNHR
jgi:hypothetical protein